MVTFNFTGDLQTFTIPANVCSVTIEAVGASGGNFTVTDTPGGLGASIQGDFTVTPGETLSILVGGAGVNNDTSGAGGGGGSFVWRGNGFVALNSSTLLVAAGGGGGATRFDNGENALIIENGGNGSGAGGGTGGTAVSGGAGGIGFIPITNGTAGGNGFGGGGGGGAASSDGGGGGGAGISGTGGLGGLGFTLLAFGGIGGLAIISGGTGGVGGPGDGGSGSAGGFGGGGGSGGDQDGSDDGGGGGGGGFAGGGGGPGGDQEGGDDGGGGGGGGSFNSGINQISTAGVGVGDGIVEITLIPDTEPPIINCPADITVSNDPGQCSAEVTYSGNATDNCSGVASVTCTHNGTSITQTFPGNPLAVTYTMTETFPVGTTTVTCTATDAGGNTSAPCSFTVTVIDTEPPTIQCPPNITVFNDPGSNGAIVQFSPILSDSCPGVTSVCSPPSGSFFPPGTTTVTCTATDAAGNTSTCSFNVRVIVDPCRFFSSRCRRR